MSISILSRIVLEIAFFVYEVYKEDKPRLSERARAEIRADLKDAPMDALVSACNSIKYSN